MKKPNVSQRERAIRDCAGKILDALWSGNQFDHSCFRNLYVPAYRLLMFEKLVRCAGRDAKCVQLYVLTRAGHEHVNKHGPVVYPHTADLLLT